MSFPLLDRAVSRMMQIDKSLKDMLINNDQRKLWIIFLCAISAISFLLTLKIFYPGLASADSIYQLEQVVGARPIGDWHPPIMVLLWKILYEITQMVGSLFLLQQITLWLSVATIAILIYTRSDNKLLSIAPFLLATSPFTYLVSATLWKDSQLAISFLAASAILLYVQSRKKASVWLMVLAMILIGYASLSRHNALIAAFPLVFVWVRSVWSTSSVTKISIATLSIMVVFLVFGQLIKIVADVQKENITSAMMLDDVVGVKSPTNFDYANLETQQRLVKIEENCKRYNIETNLYWDCAGSDDRAAFTGHLYEDLKSTWVRTIKERPFTYIQYRLYAFALFVFGNGGVQYIHTLNGIGQLGDGSYIEQPIDSYSMKIATLYTKSLINGGFSGLFRPWFWVLVSSMAFLFWFYKKRTTSSILVPMLVTSSLLYVFSYAPIAIAMDYRYIFWPVISTTLALILLFSTKGDSTVSSLHKRKDVKA